MKTSFNSSEWGKYFLLVGLLTTVSILLSIPSFSMSLEDRKKAYNEKRVSEIPKEKLAGAERSLGASAAPTNPTEAIQLGAGTSRDDGNSPGVIIGYTTYDNQHNGRMTRQVDHRGDEKVHFTWTRETTYPSVPVYSGLSLGTGYNLWDPSSGASGTMRFPASPPIDGGCDVHPRCGPTCKYSQYVGLDVDPASEAVISAQYTEGANYNTIVWYDYATGACFFGPKQCKVPDLVMQSVDPTMTEWEMLWPDIEYQVNGNDTVTHAFSKQSKDATDMSNIGYFRRVGDPTNTNCVWDYPAMLVDTVSTISQTVTASRVSGKVALVWLGNLPEEPNPPGYYESGNSGSQVNNDVYYSVSSDMGASWGNTQGNNLDKFNITASANNSAGWRAQSDLSCLIDSSDHLHIVWNAREYSPFSGGTFVHFYGSRMFHWSDDPSQNSEIRVVADANWDVPDVNSCDGGAWNKMSMVKMNVSQCEDKLYVLFVRFNDIAHGISDDCHISAFGGGGGSGGANGDLFLCVSDNAGYNWDLPRNLTNTYTPRCDTAGGIGQTICEADQWPSMARFGMYTTNLTGFGGAVIIDPSDGSDPEANYYLDIEYVNDRRPGGCVQDAGVWTINPIKWFRVPCVIPVPNPVISFSPSTIQDPTWTKPGIELDTTIRIENIGNAILHIATITPVEVNGTPGWLGIENYGPIQVSHLSPNYYDLLVYLNRYGVQTVTPVRLDGYIVFESDAAGTGTDSFEVHCIVADTVQFPEKADIRTSCIRLIFNNAGNMGNGGNNRAGGYNLNYFNDCDDAMNFGGQNNNVSIYLYDASPFVLRVDEFGDTVLNYYMFNADWLSGDGMRPLFGLYVDSTTHADYQYGYSGRFLTTDSVIGLEMELYAPTASDSCGFIISKQRFYNNTDHIVSDVFVGDLMDWDVPSDTAVRNGSGFENTGGTNSRDLMYCYGAEYGDDTIYLANNCVAADLRYGGLAFYNGTRVPYTGPADSIENPDGGWFTGSNRTWAYPTGGFQAKMLYTKLSSMGTLWETFSSTDPDSQYVDLCMVSCFGQFTLQPLDTFIFVTILSTTYDNGLTGLQSNIDKARQWIVDRPFIWQWQSIETGRCCYGDYRAPDCEDITYAACLAKPDMLSWDPSKTCWADPCPQPRGMCCYGDGDCADNMTYTSCQGMTGYRSWHEGLNCAEDSDSCMATMGRCCYGNEPIQNCAMLSYTSCMALPNAQWDSTKTCDEDCPTPPIGRCCYGDSEMPECSMEFEVYCTDRPDFLSWDSTLTCPCFDCDCEPGNCNGDTVINIFDITGLISYLYLDGPSPTPYALCSGDPNRDSVCNIFDITGLIAYLYRDGLPPCTCEEWVLKNGLPLRK